MVTLRQFALLGLLNFCYFGGVWNFCISLRGKETLYNLVEGYHVHTLIINLFLAGSFWPTSHVSQRGRGVVVWISNGHSSDDLTSLGHLRELSQPKLYIDHCLSFLPLKTVEGGDLGLSIWKFDGGAFHCINCYNSELGSCVLLRHPQSTVDQHPTSTLSW